MKRIERGSALVEAAAMLVFLSACLLFLLKGARTVAAALRLQNAARFAAAAESSALLPDGSAASLFSGTDMEVTVRRFDRTPAARFYQLVEAEARSRSQSISRRVVIHRRPE